jgi:hypothetical protein
MIWKLRKSKQSTDRRLPPQVKKVLPVDRAQSPFRRHYIVSSIPHDVQGCPMRSSRLTAFSDGSASSLCCLSSVNIPALAPMLTVLPEMAMLYRDLGLRFRIYT